LLIDNYYLIKDDSETKSEIATTITSQMFWYERSIHNFITELTVDTIYHTTNGWSVWNDKNNEHWDSLATF